MSVLYLYFSLTDMSDVKVFVDLASISAGENDREIDQVACFHDAVMGYSPLLFSLSPRAGFDQFMICARQVWDTLLRDEKLPQKLVSTVLPHYLHSNINTFLLHRSWHDTYNAGFAI